MNLNQANTNFFHSMLGTDPNFLYSTIQCEKCFGQMCEFKNYGHISTNVTISYMFCACGFTGLRFEKI